MPLQLLLDRDRKNLSSDCNVPLFFQQLIAHLEKMGLAEEGIFRIPGGMGRMRVRLNFCQKCVLLLDYQS